MDVLIIIDMQTALFDTPRYNSAGVIARINQLSAATRASGGQVIFIRHNGGAEEGLAEGSSGWQVLAALVQQPGDLFIQKTICNAFYQTELGAVLTRLQPERVIFCGCATDFCVDTTIRAAASHGLPVVVVSDAHTTADRPHLAAATIIAHHNWMWQNLIVPAAPLQLCDTQTVLTSFKSN